MLLATASCGSWNYNYNGELLGVILAWHIQLKEIPLILTTKWLIPTKLGSQGRIFSSLTLWKFNLFSLWCFSFKKQVIANCIVLLILSSALPALSRTLGKFEWKFLSSSRPEPWVVIHRDNGHFDVSFEIVILSVCPQKRLKFIQVE